MLLLGRQAIAGSASFTSSCDTPSVPVYEHATYRTSIDVKNKHLSGILILKTMDDSTIRAVFMNESGVTFFAIEYTSTEYRFLSILSSLDKHAVKRTLAKDIGMIVMRGIYDWSHPPAALKQGIELKLKRRGTVRYLSSGDCRQYSKIENYGRRKKVVSITQTFRQDNPVPECIFVEHHTVHFTISLKQLHVTE